MHEQDKDTTHKEHVAEEERLHEEHLREEQILHTSHEHVEEEIHQAHVREEEELHEKHLQEDHEGHGHEEDCDSIELTIRTTIGDWTNRFPKTELVSQVIAGTLGHFKGLKPEAYELWRKDPEQKLENGHSLDSYHLKNCEVLKLIPPDGGGQ